MCSGERLPFVSIVQLRIVAESEVQRPLAKSLERQVLEREFHRLDEVLDAHIVAHLIDGQILQKNEWKSSSLPIAHSKHRNVVSVGSDE